MTDEHDSEFRRRAQHSTDRRARGLLLAIVIALLGLVTLTILLSAGPSPIP